MLQRSAKSYKISQLCRSRKMLKDAPTLAVINVHTVENEPCEVRGLPVNTAENVLSEVETIDFDF